MAKIDSTRQAKSGKGSGRVFSSRQGKKGSGQISSGVKRGPKTGNKGTAPEAAPNMRNLHPKNLYGNN